MTASPAEALANAVYRALRRVNPYTNDLALEASIPNFLAALDAAGWVLVPKVDPEAAAQAAMERHDIERELAFARVYAKEAVDPDVRREATGNVARLEAMLAARPR